MFAEFLRGIKSCDLLSPLYILCIVRRIFCQFHVIRLFKLNKVFHKGYDSKGVGLFMTKTQIETFGGTIVVESNPGYGTEFTITL